MSEYEIQIYNSMKSPRPSGKKYTYDYQEARRIAYADTPLNGYSEILTEMSDGIIHLKGTVYHEKVGNVSYRVWESQSGMTHRFLRKDGSFGKNIRM